MKKLILRMVLIALLVSAVALMCAPAELEDSNDAIQPMPSVTAILPPVAPVAVAPSPTPETPVSQEPCPITDEEIVMLAQTMYEEAQVVYWNGTQWGVSYISRQAAVGWCALNRYDDGGFGDTLAEVLSKPHQFAWKEDAPATDHFLWLAQDIVDRWWAEKQGETNVGRTLPAGYLFFGGDGKENYFREEYDVAAENWDWSLPDPYIEA